MTSQYGQPEPFDPTAIRVAPVRARPAPRRLVLPIIGALVLTAVAFGGGFAVANAVAPKTATAVGGNGQGFGGQGLGPGASGRPRGGNGFGGGASGTVGSVSADQMTISTATGGQRIVLLTPTTTVTEVTSTKKAVTDIANGLTVTVIGTSNPDGSVTATSVIIGNANIFGRGGGRPDASAAPTTAP